MMSSSDTRSQRLEWIREGCNWLVGVSTGALVLSGTYFFEHFDGTPTTRILLVSAWILLALSSFLGVLTSFAAWKDLKPQRSADTEEEPLGGWVRVPYTAMMWTFAFGYLLLTIGLVLNVATMDPA